MFLNSCGGSRGFALHCIGHCVWLFFYGCGFEGLWTVSVSVSVSLSLYMPNQNILPLMMGTDGSLKT